MDCPRALIIGGSVGGLFAAHLLRAAGWDAIVFERSRGDLADRGASIGTRSELFAIMRRLGIAADPSIGVEARSRICLDRAGAVTHELARSSVNSAWDRIYRPLREAFPDALYRPGPRLDHVEQRDDRVTAVFDDGSRIEGDLLIAGDGIHSTVRAQLMPEIVPHYAGYVAWRGIIEERDLTAAEHDLLFGRMSFCLPEGELLLGLGMPGRDAEIRPGHRRYYWIWFRPVDPAGLASLCTDATGKCHGSSIPPSLVRPEVVRDLREIADATLAPPIAAIIARTQQPFPHGIFDLASPRLVFGRVALLGDAAFVARPHVGAGITKAALDAQGLADALMTGTDLGAALARYERERREFGTALVAWSRHLGAYLEAQLKPPADRRGVERERRPEIVLAEYGAAGKSAP